MKPFTCIDRAGSIGNREFAEPAGFEVRSYTPNRGKRGLHVVGARRTAVAYYFVDPDGGEGLDMESEQAAWEAAANAAKRRSACSAQLRRERICIVDAGYLMSNDGSIGAGTGQLFLLKEDVEQTQADAAIFNALLKMGETEGVPDQPIHSYNDNQRV